jgi:hypothetical protein
MILASKTQTASCGWRIKGALYTSFGASEASPKGLLRVGREGAE